MKLILINTLHHSKHIDSLRIACQFFPGSIDIISDYDLDITLENVIIGITDIKDYLNTLNEPVLFATSSTVFTAECFQDCVDAYQHFSANQDILLQLTFDNELLSYPEPTIIYYGGRRLWSTRSRLTSATPILYGNSKTILSTVYEQKLQFNDGIFKGIGPVTIFNPLPPLVFNLEKELPVQISSAAFDAQSYINTIPTLNHGESNETLPSSD